MGVYKLPKYLHPDFAATQRTPSGPLEVDTANHMSRGLACCYVFNNVTSTEMLDLTSLIKGTNLDPLEVYQKTDRRGRCVTFDLGTTEGGTAHGIDLGAPPRLAISEAITVVTGIRPRANQSTNWGRPYSKTNGSTGDNVGLLMEDSPNANRLHFRINNTQLSSTTDLVAEQYYNVAVRYKSGDKSIWVDGGSVASTTGQTGNITTSGNVKIGAHGSSTNRNYRGEMYYQYVFNRFLTDSELMALHRDPFQIVRPRSPVFYFTPAGAPGGVTVNLTGQSVTLSQGSLTVTGEAAVALTGQSITTTQGALTVAANSNVTLTGQSATTSQGTLTVTGQANVSLAGQSSTLSQGALAVTGEALVNLSGQQATASQGVLSVDIGGAVTVNLTGQQIASSQGALTPTGEALVNLTGQAVTSAQGTLTVSIITTPTIVNLTGQSITASDGILGLVTANVISLTGQSITLTQGSLTVTGDQPNVPEAKGINSSGSFGVGISVTATFSSGVGSKGNL